MLILLDHGHGRNTPGKQSPCATFHEYLFNRRLAAEIQTQLTARQIQSQIIAPEITDTPLYLRCRRVNDIARARPKEKILLISLHVNAAANGLQWQNARGWSVFTSPNASAYSRKAATTFAQTASQAGLKVRQPSPDQPYWVQNLAILRNTVCPAILTENLFMDNRDDLALLKSPDTLTLLARIHTDAILSLTSTP